MDAITLIPPLTAIAIALVWRNVYAALITAIVLSETLVSGFNPAAGVLGAIDTVVGVFSNPGNVRILLFCLLIGALIAFIRDSGGVAALAKSLLNSGVAKTRARAEGVVALTGTLNPIETNISLLSSGILGRPLYDAHGLSRERLAYIIDSTSAPISVLFLINAWGGYATGLIAPYDFANDTQIVFGTVMWNFYPILTILGVYLTVFTGKVIGPMRTADKRVETSATAAAAEGMPEPTRAIYMWLPLLLLIVGAIGLMTWTGGGNIFEGSGSTAILWALCLTILFTGLMLRAANLMTSGQLQDKAFQGFGEMLPLVTILLLSMALGDSLKELGTGAYVASVAEGTIAPFLVPLILFFAAGAMSFMTGTSWGTYGILVPLAMPLALSLGVPPSLALAAVLGGGVFGDHCSPISDTTIVASVASGSDHLSHVKTQLPYALIAATLASAAYIAAGLATVG